VFVFYDIQCYEDESIEAYKTRACNAYTKKWDALEEHEIRGIIKHVRENDIPQSEGFYRQEILNAGFHKIEKKFEDTQSLFALYRIGF
jgi:hypothetical protein